MNIFKNAKASILSTGTIIYTVPPATQTVVHSIYVSNITSANARVTIKVGDIRIVMNKLVLAHDYIVLDKPINMVEDEIITIVADDGNNTIEAFVSVMEIT